MKPDYPLFQMMEGHRQTLIHRHEFYVEQAKTRLLSQFEDIESEAEQAAANYLAQDNPFFDPERDDPMDAYDTAEGIANVHYVLLSDMQKQTRLSVIAGFFHQWEKSLREWLVTEVSHWHRGEKTRDTLWKANFCNLCELFELWGWDIRESPFFSDLDTCRLVVNVYKHGDGPSVKKLIEKDVNRRYIEHPFDALEIALPASWKTPRHDDLKITDEHLEQFSDAIVQFWRAVPERVAMSQIQNLPEWFKKAIEKDRELQPQNHD